MEEIKFILEAKKFLKSKKFKLILMVIVGMVVAACIFVLTLDNAKNKEGDLSSTPYVASLYIKSAKFTEHGIKFIYKNEETNQEEEKTPKEMAEILWNEMIKNDSNVEAYLDSCEEFQKLMNAEIITQFPKIADIDLDAELLNGTIEFKRYRTDGAEIPFKYVNQETFNNYLQNKDTNIVNYYTMDENFNVLIGVISETKYTLTSNDSDYTEILNNEIVGNKTEYTVSSKNIPYKNVISKYTMPFQYLWDIILVGGDKGVGLELADLVEKSQIVISIYDNETTSENTTTYTYSKNDENYQIEQKTIYKNSTPIVDLTKADVWIVDYSKDYTYQGEETTKPEINERSYFVDDINVHEKNEYIQSTPKYANTINNEPKVKRKTKQEIENGTGQNNFVTILCDMNHYSAKKRLTYEDPEWLFKILEENQDTVNMVEMTKYLLNKVLGRDEFETTFTFDEFANNNFYSVANIFGNNCEEKVWFALIAEGYSEYSVAGLMGNLMQESGFKSNNLQNTYEKSLGMTDETYTNGVNSGTYTNFIHDEAGYGLAQWTFWSRKEALYAFSKEMGTTIDDEDMQINFLIKEIKERGCPQWQSATNVQDACYYFEKEFEQAGKPQMGNRLTYANDIYYRYQGKTAPTTVEVKLTGENKKKMEALLQEAQRIANDNRYTYSQNNRDGEFQYDCSSLVYRLYAQFFGIQVPTYTGAYGAQYRVGGSTSVELQPGDVLWRAGHVTLYIGNGVYVAAHGCEGKYANNPASQISVYNDSPSAYTYVYRFITN